MKKSDLKKKTEIDYVGDIVYVDGIPKYYIRGMTHFGTDSKGGRVDTYVNVYKLAGSAVSDEHVKDLILSIEDRDK